MIFFEEQFVSNVWTGRKTQICIFGRKRRWKVGGIHQARTRDRIGNRKDPFALLIILKVEQKCLGDLTDEDAKREGFNSLEDFKAFWVSVAGWPYNFKVWVVEFITVSQRIVNEWNSKYPVGTPVKVITDCGRVKDSVTETPAYLWGNGTPVIDVEGQGHAYTLKRVKPRDGQFDWADKWWINAPRDPELKVKE